jgi:hypothetical protein
LGEHFKPRYVQIRSDLTELCLYLYFDFSRLFTENRPQVLPVRATAIAKGSVLAGDPKFDILQRLLLLNYTPSRGS